MLSPERGNLWSGRGGSEWPDESLDSFEQVCADFGHLAESLPCSPDVAPDAGNGHRHARELREPWGDVVDPLSAVLLQELSGRSRFGEVAGELCEVAVEATGLVSALLAECVVVAPIGLAPDGRRRRSSCAEVRPPEGTRVSAPVIAVAINALRGEDR